MKITLPSCRNWIFKNQNQNGPEIDPNQAHLSPSSYSDFSFFSGTGLESRIAASLGGEDNGVRRGRFCVSWDTNRARRRNRESEEESSRWGFRQSKNSPCLEARGEFFFDLLVRLFSCW